MAIPKSQARLPKLFIKQAGEYLVAAEICRRGMVATTFSGNMPHYDVLAHAADGRLSFVQVKTKNALERSWLLSTEFFLEFDQLPTTHVIRSLRAAPLEPLVFVFVELSVDSRDAFYVLSFQEIQAVLQTRYLKWLSAKDRPKVNPSDIPVSLLSPYQDAWETILMPHSN